KDVYMDQLHYCGHYQRTLEDIDHIAALGIKAMRYPVIWERLHPYPGHTIDWHSVDVPLNALRNHGVKPVVGLVHHGSGPRYADILSDAFVHGLSNFARKVAVKFPWIEYFTPVNEPLTTARFSALYGFWFPHRRSDRAFAQALVNEMKAVVMSMREIRKINPDAKLVQTEDLTKIYSTPHLRYQANFENHRRWLTCDFLCGMVTREHPLWDYFIRQGITEDSLSFFVDNPCPPDIIGLDYYATSERFLDEDLRKYPPAKHGSNHVERYADVEAFRVRHGQPSGIKLLLRECWERYHLPMVVTEVHINCDFDNQIRWFSEIRNACISLMNTGVDIKAVTAWSLFGSYGWNSLLTKIKGEYESGVFDLSSGIPVPTPVADYLIRLEEDPWYVHPVESEKGWWCLEDRFIFDGYAESELVEAEMSETGCDLKGEEL
ncbi:MAG TPA: family 1 glycosylhydrolase, partial [Chryseosolibacter sp.]